MGTSSLLFWVVFCGILGQTFGASTETYFLDEQCGNVLDMQSLGVKSGRMVLRRSDIGLVNFNCVVFIRAPDAKQIVFKVVGLDIVAPFGCTRDYLQFYDGVTSMEPLSDALCGYTTPNIGFVSTRSEATVVFAKKLDYMNDQFEVIFTAVRRGPCENGEYSCKNGLCIANDLYCDGYDNCGDESDVCLLSVGVIVGIVIAAIVILILIALVIAIVIQRRRRQRLEKWHRLHHSYSFNGSSTLSLPRSRMDYSLPRSMKSISFRSSTLPRMGNEYAVSKEDENADIYATVMKDKANYKIHVLDASSLPRDIKPVGPEADHVVSFRSYPAPVPKLDDEIVHSTPLPNIMLNGFVFGPNGSIYSDSRTVSRNPSYLSTHNVHDLTDPNSISRNHSTKSTPSQTTPADNTDVKYVKRNQSSKSSTPNNPKDQSEVKSVSRNPSSKSTASSILRLLDNQKPGKEQLNTMTEPSKAASPANSTNSKSQNTTKDPIHSNAQMKNIGDTQTEMTEVTGHLEGQLKEDPDFFFRNDTTDAKASRERDARGSFDLVRL